MKRRTRPIGQHIRRICETLEMHGTCTARIAYEHLNGSCDRENTSKYLNRAAQLGFVVVDKSEFPARYTVTLGWREVISPPKESECAVKLTESQMNILSVWYSKNESGD